MESNAFELVQGINSAIEFEKEFQKFYSIQEKTTKNSFLKKIFSFLTQEEKKHELFLKKIKKTLKEKGIWSNEKKIKSNPELLKFIKKEKSIQKNLTQNELNVIFWAMESEKRAQKFYNKLKQKSKGNEGKAFFEQMIEFEKQHFELLNQLIKKE